MQYVGIYDKNGYVAEQIKSMKFWSVRNDFELTEIIHDKNEIFMRKSGLRRERKKFDFSLCFLKSYAII